jgi:hypothetical protein
MKDTDVSSSKSLHNKNTPPVHDTPQKGLAHMEVYNLIVEVVQPSARKRMRAAGVL